MIGSLATDRMLLCCDFNCPGTSSDAVDVGLCRLLDTQTRAARQGRHTIETVVLKLLDLIITVASSTLLSEVEVIDSAGILDHSLVH